MSKQSSPLLSIGIIFKNEIRCLERCLKSLEPLRKAVPCELIMGDTGSDDGSRQIAEQRADLVIDVPWTDDFSAARNAVMDRCSGAWYFSIDCDEWLDPDIKELLRVFSGQYNYNFFSVKIRNYKTPELEKGGAYMDSFTCRLLRMSTGMRYQNALHEGWDSTGQIIVVLKATLLYHDGYVFVSADKEREKEARNLSILHNMLEAAPHDLQLLLQAYESSYCFPEEHLSYVRQGVQGVEEKWKSWEKCGPALMRYAVMAAKEGQLPELERWISRAVELFPESIVVRVDVSYTALCNCWDKDDYASCVRWGEEYLKAVKDFECGNFDVKDVSASPVITNSTVWQQSVRSFLAAAYLKLGQLDRCAAALEELTAYQMDDNQIEEAMRTILGLSRTTNQNTRPLVLALWERTAESQERREIFARMAYEVFDPEFQEHELKEPDFYRLSYMAFLPLADRCDLGRGAAILNTEDVETASSYLIQVEDWNKLPVLVLEHALELGVPFPLESRPLTLEEMDTLAGRMSRKVIINLAIQAVDNTAESNWQSVIWARELTLAAIQSDCWSEEDRGMNLCRAFAKIESATLPRYYGDEALKEENISTLPPAHRFGWYCIRAFEALDAGDRKEYMHLLRLGLTSCPAMKSMVEFLVANTPEIKETITPSSELLSLAEQVRTLLASFAPGDPALEAIRSSEAYQKVAYLIEGTDAGGLPS